MANIDRDLMIGFDFRVSEVAHHNNETRAEFFGEIQREDNEDYVILENCCKDTPFCFGDYKGQFIVYSNKDEMWEDMDDRDGYMRLYDWLKLIGITQ